MQALIEDILTFSKLAHEEKTFQNSDLNVLIKDVLQEMDMLVKEKKAKIVVEKLPLIYANPGLIRPLFFNLINNALKYSKKEEDPIIQIRSEVSLSVNHSQNKEPAKNFCRIFIQDNGIGFEQKYAEQIFGMFKRLHQKSEYEGTGIGLAICKKIAEQHNGSISAKSRVGEGSTFIVSLPMVSV